MQYGASKPLSGCAGRQSSWASQPMRCGALDSQAVTRVFQRAGVMLGSCLAGSQPAPLGSVVLSDAVVAFCKHCGRISAQLVFTLVVQLSPPQAAPVLVPKSSSSPQLPPAQLHFEQVAGSASGW